MTTTGKELLSIDPHGKWDMNFPFRPAVVAVAFSPDGDRFATAGSVAKVGGRHGLPGGVRRVGPAQALAELGEVLSEAQLFQLERAWKIPILLRRRLKTIRDFFR